MRPLSKLLLAMLGLLLLSGCGSKSGSQALDFSLVPLDDQAGSVRMSDFKGKTVLLDFWATWCGPCNEAMPEVQEVWDKYRDKGLAVVAITSEDRNVVLGFHQSGPLYTYPVYLDPGGAASSTYGVEAIPAFFLIRDGKVLWSSEGIEKGDLLEHVKQVLG